MQPIGGWSLAAPSGRLQAQWVACTEQEIAVAICAVRRGLIHILWKSEKAELQGNNGVSVIRAPCNVVSLHGFCETGTLHVLFGGEDAKLYGASIAVRQLPVQQISWQEVVITRATQLSSSEQRQLPPPQPIQALLVHHKTCFVVDGKSLAVLEMNHDFTAGLLKERLPFADTTETCVHMSIMIKEQTGFVGNGIQSMSSGLFDVLFQAHCQEPAAAVGLIALESGRSLWYPISSNASLLPQLLPFHNSLSTVLDIKVQAWSGAVLEGLFRDTLGVICTDGRLSFFSGMNKLCQFAHIHQRQSQQQQQTAVVLSSHISLTSASRIDCARFHQGGLVYCSDDVLWIQSLERNCSGDVCLAALRKLPSAVPRFLSSTSVEGYMLLVGVSGKINCYQTGPGGKEQDGNGLTLSDQLNNTVKILKSAGQQHTIMKHAVTSLTEELVHLSNLTALLRTSNDPATVRFQIRSSFQITVTATKYALPTILLSQPSACDCLLVVTIHCLKPTVLNAVLPYDIVISCRQDEPAVTGSQRVEHFCFPMRHLFATDRAAAKGTASVQIPWRYESCHACSVDVTLQIPLCQTPVPLPRTDTDGPQAQWHPSPVSGVAVHLARQRLMHTDVCDITDDQTQSGSGQLAAHGALSWRPLAWTSSTRPFTVRLRVPLRRRDDISGREWSHVCQVLAAASGQQVSEDSQEVTIHSPLYGRCSLRPYVQPERTSDASIQILAQTASACLLVSIHAALCRAALQRSSVEDNVAASYNDVGTGSSSVASARAPPGARYSLSLPVQQAYQWCEATLRALEADVQQATKETFFDIWKHYKILRQLHG